MQDLVGSWMQNSLFKSALHYELKNEMEMPEVDWVAPDEFPDLRNCDYIAVDLETSDPNLLTKGPGWVRDDGFIVGVAIAAGDFTGYYPIKHEGGGNISGRRVKEWLKAQLATPDIPKIMHNALYDLGWLRWAKIPVQGRIIDTMIAAPLLDENRFSYSLNNLGRDYLAMSKDEKGLRAAAKAFGVDPKKDLWKLPARYVGHYAEQDARITLNLWKKFETEIVREKVTSIFDMETKLLPVLLDMKQVGVKVNTHKAELIKKDFLLREQKLLLDIKKETSIELEPWVSTSIAKIFEYYKIPYEKTDKTNKPSFTKSSLQACPHPIAAKILKVRELNKAQKTFIDSIIDHAHKDRIHCEFHQLRSEDGGTVTGRFSSSNPNLQQIPARDPEIKKLIRGLFEPELGEKWGSFDYSSQEPRLLVHYCSELNEEDRHPLIDEVVAKYHEGDDDFHQMVADMAGITRTEAKTVNLGIMYGMGQGKLAATLDITIDDAKKLLDQYHEKVPFVKGLANRISVYAQKHGKIRTILGRRCRFDLWEPCTFGYNKALPKKEAMAEYGPQRLRRAFTYKALNKLIQGSAADQTKKAMLDCYEKGHLPLLSVHDELCFSIHSEEQAKEITEIMETGLPLKVPSKVDQELGDNWGEVG